MGEAFNFNVAGILPTNTLSKSGDPLGDDINKTVEEFAKLLIAQITNQDPDKPVEMTETITQYSQMLSSLGQIKANNALVQFGQVNVSTDIIGKRIAYTKGKTVDPETKQLVDIRVEDVVTEVDFTGTNPAVKVAGSKNTVPVKDIIGIYNNSASEITANSPTNAAQLVGKNVHYMTMIDNPEYDPVTAPDEPKLVEGLKKAKVTGVTFGPVPLLAIEGETVLVPMSRVAGVSDPV